MRYLPHTLFLFILCMLLPAFPTTAYAQQVESCFNLFDDLTDPTFSCADASYFVDGADGGDDLLFFGDVDTGLLGADFDGFDIFDPEDPELAPPDNLLDPFFSDVQYSSTNMGGQVTNFDIQHRGSVSMGTRDSQFQSAAYGSKSRITFIPFTTDDSTDPLILDLDFSFEFTLRDPSDNATSGAAQAAAGVQIISDDPLEPLFDFEGLAELDLEFDDDPIFFGDFDSPASDFEPSGPGIDDEFDLDVEFKSTFPATPGQPLTLDSDTFGAIFSDGFESGDTSAWSSTSENTFVVSVSSGNPNVRFMFNFVAEPQDINYGLAGGWFNLATPGQGFLFDFLLDRSFMFVAAFTFDTISPQAGGNISGAEQRWFTAQGDYSGNRAVLTISQTRNGLFDDPQEVTSVAVGTMVIEFTSCTTAIITYDLPGFGLSGTIPISKLLADEICTRINDGGIVLEAGGKAGTTSSATTQAANFSSTSSAETQDINYGLIGGWFNLATPGQGFLFDFLLERSFMFVAAFTFDTISPQAGGNISGAEQRWFTAQGDYAGNRAVLTISQTRNGLFDDPAVVTSVAVGTMVIEFTSCTTAIVTYDLPGFGLSGTIPISKLLADEICTRINDGDIVLSR